MSAHTRGPWVVRPSIRGSSKQPNICTAAEIPYAIASVCGGDRDANARLIAASPDLYAALRDATDALDYVHAIDSVTPPECDPDDGLCGAQFCAQNGCLVRKIAVARAALAKALAKGAP